MQEVDGGVVLIFAVGGEPDYRAWCGIFSGPCRGNVKAWFVGVMKDGAGLKAEIDCALC